MLAKFSITSCNCEIHEIHENEKTLKIFGTTQEKIAEINLLGEEIHEQCIVILTYQNIF